jgi:hypothetical protein
MISLTPSLLVSLSLRRGSRKSQLLNGITWISSILCFIQIPTEVGREPVEIHFSKVWLSLRRLSRTPCLIDFFLTRNEILWKSDRRFSRRYWVTHKARRINGRCLNVSVSFCGRFRKIAKKKLAASYPSVYLSTWNNSAPTGRIFMKFDIWVFFENLWKIFKLHQNLTTITGTLDEDLPTLMILSRRMLLRMRDVSDKICRKKSNTCFIFSNCFPHKSCRLWDNVEKYCRAGQAADDNMAHAHCMLDN